MISLRHYRLILTTIFIGGGVMVVGLTLVIDRAFIAELGSGAPMLSVCGNTQVEFGEECDWGPINGQLQSRCSSECRIQPMNTFCMMPPFIAGGNPVIMLFSTDTSPACQQLPPVAPGTPMNLSVISEVIQQIMGMMFSTQPGAGGEGGFGGGGGAGVGPPGQLPWGPPDPEFPNPHDPIFQPQPVDPLPVGQLPWGPPDPEFPNPFAPNFQPQLPVTLFFCIHRWVQGSNDPRKIGYPISNPPWGSPFCTRHSICRNSVLAQGQPDPKVVCAATAEPLEPGFKPPRNDGYPEYGTRIHGTSDLGYPTYDVCKEQCWSWMNPPGGQPQIPPANFGGGGVGQWRALQGIVDGHIELRCIEPANCTMIDGILICCIARVNGVCEGALPWRVIPQCSNNNHIGCFRFNGPHQTVGACRAANPGAL